MAFRVVYSDPKSSEPIPVALPPVLLESAANKICAALNIATYDYGNRRHYHVVNTLYMNPHLERKFDREGEGATNET